MFGRELCILDEVQHDIRFILQTGSSILAITSRLKLIADAFAQGWETHEKEQHRRKAHAD